MPLSKLVVRRAMERVGVFESFGGIGKSEKGDYPWMKGFGGKEGLHGEVIVNKFWGILKSDRNPFGVQ